MFRSIVQSCYNFIVRSFGSSPRVTNKAWKMPSTINFHSITPNEYKKMKGFQITYGVSQTKFGNCLVGLNSGSICYLSFFDEGNENSAIDKLNADWPNAVLSQKNEAVAKIATDIFDNRDGAKEFNVLVKGTDLQVNVWKELVNLREGTTANYEQIAKAVGNPKAIMAVASAIAKNKIAYVIPCHRVIRKQGATNKYRWGPARKESILKYEANL